MIVSTLIVNLNYKRLPIWRQLFVNNGYKKNVFVFFWLLLSKSSKFRVVWTIRLCSNFTSICTFLWNVWRDFRLPMSAIATVARKSFNGKFTAKIDFPIGHFMLPLLMLTLEVQSLFIHYLICIWSICWWNLNKIVWSEPCKILCFLTKNVQQFLTKC